MMRFILRRLVQVPLTLLAVYTLTVLLAWAVPGNPLENPEGPQPPPEAVEAMKARYNLDSTWRFYWSYLDGASGVGALRDAHVNVSRIFQCAGAGLLLCAVLMFLVKPSRTSEGK